MAVNPIPEGFSGATPYLCCKNAAEMIEFYKKAFGAKELYRMNMPDSQIVGHAEMQIGEAKFMLSEEFPDWGNLSPVTLGGTGSTVVIYVNDVDAFAAHAVANGAKSLMPVMDQFWGDRSTKLADPSGHHWMFSTHIEDVPPEDFERRMKESESCK